MKSNIRFSIIIPTFQRKDLVLKSVKSLAFQEYSGEFEVIVVVDGSTDGTAAALREIFVPFQFIVLEQTNQGAAKARNYGAEVANGIILLFLDDDMEAHPRMLLEHEHSHSEGADIVLGHIPLHPESPPSFLSSGVKLWANERLRRLTSPNAKLTLHDLITGQISIPVEVFKSVGGFSTAFTNGGSFGNEDIDFGYRLQLKGYKFVFNPNAISWQYYIVQPRQYLHRLYQTGQADKMFSQKYPDLKGKIFELSGANRKLNRFFWRPLQRLPLIASLISNLLFTVTLNLLDRGLANPILLRLFRETGSSLYWQGVYGKRGIRKSKSLHVLAYHAISNLPKGSPTYAYGVPPCQFERQLDELKRSGYHFLSAEEFLMFLNGNYQLTRHSLLLTFDDGYSELLDVVLPLLRDRSIPAVVFVVSRLIGRTNEWDETKGMLRLTLLDVNGLYKLTLNGIMIGAHSRTHRSLPSLSYEEMSDEINGSIKELDKWGLGQAILFSYPYGEYNNAILKVVQQSGIKAAFTVKPGRIKPKQNPFLVPRIEVLNGDVGWRLRLKIITAGNIWNILKQVKTLYNKTLAKFMPE
jgi:glycosyltransferase involved in cell wall biosynthesis